MRNRNKIPIYSSSIKTYKHTDPVWQVLWNADISKNYNFYSISSDGRVMNWIMMKDKLEPEEVIRLKLVNKKNKQSDEETSLISLACGLCFDFNKFDPFTFIVGTEEGNVHKCSKAYSGQYQETYDGHQLAIYKSDGTLIIKGLLFQRRQIGLSKSGTLCINHRLCPLILVNQWLMLSGRLLALQSSWLYPWKRPMCTIYKSTATPG